MDTALFNEQEIALLEDDSAITSSDKPFIQANTIDATVEEIRHKHVIPVFIKDNEPVISHSDFIESTMGIVSSIFQRETILKPSVRLSLL